VHTNVVCPVFANFLTSVVHEERVVVQFDIDVHKLVASLVSEESGLDLEKAVSPEKGPSLDEGVPTLEHVLMRLRLFGTECDELVVSSVEEACSVTLSEPCSPGNLFFWPQLPEEQEAPAVVVAKSLDLHVSSTIIEEDGEDADEVLCLAVEKKAAAFDFSSTIEEEEGEDVDVVTVGVLGAKETAKGAADADDGGKYSVWAKLRAKFSALVAKAGCFKAPVVSD
jgi:hypothetical protein